MFVSLWTENPWKSGDFFHGISTEFSVIFHWIFMARVNGFFMDFYPEKHMKTFWISHEIPLNISHFRAHENFGIKLKTMKYPWIYHEILIGIDVAISWLFHGNEKPMTTKFNGGPGFQDPWKNHGFCINMKIFMGHENICRSLMASSWHFEDPWKSKLLCPHSFSWLYANKFHGVTETCTMKSTLKNHDKSNFWLHHINNEVLI